MCTEAALVRNSCMLLLNVARGGFRYRDSGGSASKSSDALCCIAGWLRRFQEGEILVLGKTKQTKPYERKIGVVTCRTRYCNIDSTDSRFNLILVSRFWRAAIIQPQSERGKHFRSKHLLEYSRDRKSFLICNGSPTSVSCSLL